MNLMAFNFSKASCLNFSVLTQATPSASNEIIGKCYPMLETCGYGLIPKFPFGLNVIKRLDNATIAFIISPYQVHLISCSGCSTVAKSTAQKEYVGS